MGTQTGPLAATARLNRTIVELKPRINHTRQSASGALESNHRGIETSISALFNHVGSIA